jgi:hypothetical protein
MMIFLNTTRIDGSATSGNHRHGDLGVTSIEISIVKLTISSTNMPAPANSRLVRYKGKLLISGMADELEMNCTLGHAHLRHRLILSLLSHRPVRVDDIRSDDEDPGINGRSTCYAVCKCTRLNSDLLRA